MASKRDLPLIRVKGDELPIWDPRKALACGYLYKKAGKGKMMSSGRFALRFFLVNTRLGAYDNYTLDHYENVDDKLPKKQYPLAGATVNPLSPGLRFEVICADGSALELKAETEDSAVRWVVSLHKVIEIANDRQGVIQNLRATAAKDAVKIIFHGALAMRGTLLPTDGMTHK